MLDDIDDGARIGLWTVLGIVALLLFGMLGGFGIRSLQAATTPVKVPAPSAAASAATTPSITAEVVMVDTPLAGDLVGMIYFEPGQALLPPQAPSAIDVMKDAVQSAPGHKLLLSGFHDASGDAARNAALAAQRAKAVREALLAAGVDPASIALRRPESTTGSGSERQARRVEVRLLP